MARIRIGRRVIAAGLATTAIGVLAPVLAHAQTTVGHIDGSPLDVYADGQGSLQARFDGKSDGEFYSPGSDAAHAGLEIVDTTPGTTASGRLTATTVSGPTLTRSGGTQRLHSVYDESNGTSPLYRVTEDVTYQAGATEFRLHYVIQNLQAVAGTFRAGELADLYTGDSDSGTGILDATPPRFVGGRSPTGGSGGLREITPWSHFQESQYGQVFSNFEFGQGLDDTVDPTSVDYGAGAQWDFTNLGSGASATIDVAWQFQPGTLTLTTPQYRKSVNLLQAKGLVKYKVPGAKRFTTLTSGAQVPMGTTLDTKKGRVNLVSADRFGLTQQAGFYQGVFKVKGQTKGTKPITLLDLAGPKPKCGKAASTSSAAIARKRRSRHLWGNGKGRFRTTGQFSSATVRGTIWLTQDSCRGTLVKVKRGVVAVKDFTKHRTFLVKAGHSHLAVPPHKKKK